MISFKKFGPCTIEFSLRHTIADILECDSSTSADQNLFIVSINKSTLLSFVAAANIIGCLPSN